MKEIELRVDTEDPGFEIKWISGRATLKKRNHAALGDALKNARAKLDALVKAPSSGTPSPLSALQELVNAGKALKEKLLPADSPIEDPSNTVITLTTDTPEQPWGLICDEPEQASPGETDRDQLQRLCQAFWCVKYRLVVIPAKQKRSGSRWVPDLSESVTAQTPLKVALVSDRVLHGQAQQAMGFVRPCDTKLHRDYHQADNLQTAWDHVKPRGILALFGIDEVSNKSLGLNEGDVIGASRLGGLDDASDGQQRRKPGIFVNAQGLTEAIVKPDTPTFHRFSGLLGAEAELPHDISYAFGHRVLDTIQNITTKTSITEVVTAARKEQFPYSLAVKLCFPHRHFFEPGGAP